MTELKLKSVGRGPLSCLLEQWWVTVAVVESGSVVGAGAEVGNTTVVGAGAAGRPRSVAGVDAVVATVRVAVEWSPWSREFFLGAQEVVTGHCALSRSEFIAAYRNSPCEQQALELIRGMAGRFHSAFPERVASLEGTR